MCAEPRVAAVGVLVMLVSFAAGSGSAMGQASAKAQVRAPNVYLYDMGSDSSPLWVGFKPVSEKTAYDSEQGYGWVVKRDNKARSYVAEYLDALAIDHVNDRADATLTFRQDLPNGEYDVWVLTGSHVSLDYLLYPHALQLQGRSVREIRPRKGEVFRAVKYEWSQGDDIYDHFIPPRFTWLRHEASVTDGKLMIGFTHARAFPVCAIVIAEKTLGNAMDEEIKKLDVRRKVAFCEIWNEIPPKTGTFEPVSEEEQDRGYIVSAVNYPENIFPWSGPPAGASRSMIEIFATRGEQEQASFCVYALTNLRAVTFDVTDLRTADGKVIPRSAIRPGLVQFAPKRIRHNPHYRIHPALILPLRPTFIGESTCKQFWATVFVREDAAAGIYEGTIRISSLDAPPSTLRLRLRVLPFKLMEPPFERYLYFGSMRIHARRLMGPFDEKTYWDSIRAETRFLKEHGHTIAAVWLGGYTRYLKRDKNGDVADINLSATEKLMQIVKEEGVWPRDNRMVCLSSRLNSDFGGLGRGRRFCNTPQDRANFIKAIRIINEKAKKAGWPEIVFECGGEYTNFGKMGAEFAVAAHKTFREAGVSNSVRGNGPSDMEAIHAKLVHYPQPNPAMMKKEWLDFMKANSKALWVYNFSTGRMGYGWFCFRHGVARASHEVGIYFHRQPGNIFDNTYGDWPLALPLSLTSFAPDVRFKRIVEGADDYKYLCMLDQLIKKGAASGNAEAQKVAREARAWLDKKLKCFPDGISEVREPIDWYNEVRDGISWYPGDYDKYRWQMAEFIMALQKGLGE